MFSLAALRPMVTPPKASSSCLPEILNNIYFGLFQACLFVLSGAAWLSPNVRAFRCSFQSLLVLSQRVARLVSNVGVRSSPSQPCAILSTHLTHRLLRNRLPGTCALPRRAPPYK